jgi:transposase
MAKQKKSENNRGKKKRTIEEVAGVSLDKRDVTKREVYAIFVDWWVHDEEEREASGMPKTQKDFAARYDVSQDTLTDWKKRGDFVMLQGIALQKKVAMDAPMALSNLKKRIKKYGKADDVELFLNYGGWDKKRVVELKPPVEFGEGDIRALVAKLPADKQKKYLDTLAGLIADAVNADDDITF